jgi:hypothetical protein
MDATHLDYLARSLKDASSRRLFGGLTAALGLTALEWPGSLGAKKKRKRKHKHKHKNQKSLVLNAFGCVDVGKECRGDSANCCSGICQGSAPKKGQKDTSVCVAHDASTCQAGQKSVGCGGEADVACVTTTGAAGQCQTTTGNGAYCRGIDVALECNRDADCQAEIGPLAACVVCAASGTGSLCAGPG